MAELDLLKNYPKTSRDLDQRIDEKTEEIRKVARQFGQEFFDGDRKYGYGGYSYSARFWQPVAPDFQKQYNLSSSSRVLDVGCAKGFMLFDFMQGIPGIRVQGIDISEYAIENAKKEVKPFLKVASAAELPFEDNSFDLAISINTVHNLAPEDCLKAIAEMQRVSKGGCFLTVDAYRDEEEKKRMDAWNLTAKTYMSVYEWKEFFKKAGYRGDYFWFIP